MNNRLPRIPQRRRAALDLEARAQKARPNADADAFQPTDADVVGTLNVPPVHDGQEIDPKGSGDLVAGGFEDNADDRTPQVGI